MARLAQGDRSVFHAVYAGLWPAMLELCRHMLPPGEVEDAAQQAMLRLFEQASTFDPERDAVGWALTIAAWECRSMRRKQQRARTAPFVEEQHPTDEGTPEGLSLERELLEAATTVLGQLSPSDRQTLLATFAEQGHGEVPAATFRKRRERALARLRAAWMQLYGAG